MRERDSVARVTPGGAESVGVEVGWGEEVLGDGEAVGAGAVRVRRSRERKDEGEW